ncbi:MAG: divalent-cation tolerance protein CutA [Oligoflexus sp.]
MSTQKRSDMLLVYMTFDQIDEAKRLARALVENNLAACCNLIPGMQSIYHWQGKIEEASEMILLAKTNQAGFPALKDYVVKHHSYECPCVMAIPVSEVHEPYLAWLHSGIKY